ncbi:hypothetical protein, partial [Deinococcus aetherius]
MSWKLELFGPNGQTLKKTLTETSPGGVGGGFHWRRTGQGGCILLDFPGHAPALGLRNRDLLRLWVNGARQFYGVVQENPNPRDPNFGDVTVEGAGELLGRRIIGAEVYRNLDVGAIARRLVERYRHPALTYNPDLIPDTGKVLETWSLPFRTLRQALKSLGETVAGEKGVPFDVLPDGAVFFGGSLTSATPFAYADVKDFLPLRVTGDEVATRSYLIALSRASGAAPTRTWIFPVDRSGAREGPPGSQTSAGLPYAPGTYTLRADDPDYAELEAEVAHLAPDGADVFTSPGAYPGATVVSGGLRSPDAARDGDLSTCADNTPGTASSYLQYDVARGVDAHPVVGFRLTYSLDLTGAPEGAEADVSLYTIYDNPAGETLNANGNRVLLNGTAFFSYALANTGGQPRDVVAVTPLPQEVMQEVMPGAFTASTPTPCRAVLNVGCRTNSTAMPDGSFRVYRFEPIGLDRAKVDALARKSLNPPAQVPAQFDLPYLLAPTPVAALTGVPGGDLLGDVAELEYRHDKAGLTTSTVKLEQPGASETARLLRIIARARAQDAQTELR